MLNVGVLFCACFSHSSFFVPRITVSVVSFSRLTLSLVPLKDYWLCGHSHTNQAQARCKTMSTMTGTDTDSTTSGCCRISELCRSAELSYWKYFQFNYTRLMRDFWVHQAGVVLMTCVSFCRCSRCATKLERQCSSTVARRMGEDIDRSSSSPEEQEAYREGGRP